MLQQRDDRPYNILYAGRKTQRELAKVLLGVDNEMGSSQTLDLSSRTVIISEMPIPGALRVPQAMHFVIPLGRLMEEITAGFESELRRRLRKCWGRYSLQQVVDDTEIARIDRDMLQPYAKARHGIGASQIGSDELHRMAQAGRVELVLLEDQVVACQTGCASTRAGKRYWVSIRFGYPEAIFSDPKRLGETNAINFYLALEWALQNGFDYYHMGSCLARPEDDLLQWKKRWGGVLYTTGNHGYFYIRLPKTGAAQFLWDAPLFAVEQNNPTLHLGLPTGTNDEEAASRYRKMSFGGLFKVYLHCARPPGKRLLESLTGLYSHQKRPPILECITAH